MTFVGFDLVDLVEYKSDIVGSVEQALAIGGANCKSHAAARPAHGLGAEIDLKDRCRNAPCRCCQLLGDLSGDLAGKEPVLHAVAGEDVGE